tara:strand:+ start:181 stop:489 length:309 start_codon:yes stop_codon:yes gene_type:complete
MSSFKSELYSYYKYYLNLHTNPKCRLLHFIGQIVTIIFTIDVLYNGWWYLIPVIPFVVYPFAWSGHYFFEGNKPAAFSNPLYAKISDWLMFRDIILGKLSIW